VHLRPGLDRLHSELLLFGLALWQSQKRGESNVGRDHGLAALGTCPQYRLVVLLIPVGIFHSDLRLADAAQAADGLRLAQGGAVTGGEPLMELCEHLLSPGEEGVAPVGHVPERRRVYICGTFTLRRGNNPSSLADLLKSRHSC
jgi:hypothetical protein